MVLNPDFDAEAHRGGRDRRPENTLAAFEYAVKLGVTTLELDIGVTKDRVIVASHNPMLNHEITRTEDGRFIPENAKIFIKDLTFNELKKYDVGMLNANTQYGFLHREQTPVPGEKIPSLEQIFKLINDMGAKNIRFNIEIKTYPTAPEYTIPRDEIIKLLLETIKKYDVENRVSVQSFDWNSIKLFRSVSPHIPIGCLTVSTFEVKGEKYNLKPDKNGSYPWLAGFNYDDYRGNLPKLVKDFGGDIFSPYYKELTQTDIEKAHKLGLRVVVWTVNEPGSIRRMLSWGVDGIISDRPDELLKILKTKK